MRIRTTIRTNGSPRHVPAKIIEILAVPYTLNMKKVEPAVNKIIEGRPVLKVHALSNPEGLDLYQDIKGMK